tara:strand:- start:698 stop:955 length:258 start_codon:yes stop_codon:yes gene_type:complete
MLKMVNKETESVVTLLNELKDDHTVPRNVRVRIDDAIKILDEDTEMEIKVSKVLHGLEEIADDVNLQSYTRTQIWDIISSLEKIK